MGKNIKVLVSLITVVGLLACNNKKSDSTESSSSSNEFSGLAEVTGPVSGNSSTSYTLGALAATNGVSLSSPGSFSSGTSLPFCENVNLVKEILKEAASPDKILCYMGKMKANNVIPSTLDLADGNTKYVKLLNLPDNGHGNSRPTVKFQIIKTDGAISSFKMWSCFGGSAATPAQSEYISEIFSGSTATVQSKYTGSESGSTYGSNMTATGTFSGGAWASKNISGYRYYSQSGNSNVMTLNMNQYADRVDMGIAMKGRFGSSTYLNKFFSVVQLIGSSLSNFALGDGSSKFSMSYDSDSNGSAEYSNTGTVSWNGDTRSNLSTASNGDYYTLANSGTVPNDPNASQTVTFSTDETWDCSLPSDQSWIEADFNNGGTGISEGMQACEQKYLGNGGGWLSCPY